MSEREKTQVEGEDPPAPDVIATRRAARPPNPRQVRFAVELAKLGGVGATEAARRAGYTEETARKAIWQLLRKPQIRDLVEKHMKLCAAAAEVTESRVIMQAAQWLFMTDADAVKRGIKITSAMRCKGLEILARATGLTDGDQHEHQHLHAAPAVQFILPTNDRVPVDGANVIERPGNGRGNGRDHEPPALPPSLVIDLPPLESDDE